MPESFRPEGPDRRAGLSRRDFANTVAAAALAASAARAGAEGKSTGCTGLNPPAASETAVGRFYRSLKPDQKKALCFASDHPLRSRVGGDRAIVGPVIGDLTGEQRHLCREVFRRLCSDEGYERFTRQMNDDSGGFDRYHVAVFGEPGMQTPFEWVLTGRHATLRADGNGAEAAFGGPIFYGHSAEGRGDGGPGRTNNVWWYQARSAGEIFATLDDSQKAQALVGRSGPDTHRRAKRNGDHEGEIGLSVGSLDGPQKQAVQRLLNHLISPFRTFDAEEVRVCLEDADGADSLRLAYFNEGEVGDDGACDVWKLEGPAFSWYFHGSPHVHAWLDVDRRGSGPGTRGGRVPSGTTRNAGRC